MKVKVLFLGVLAEVAGTDCRVYNDTYTMNDLIHRIIDDFPEVVGYNYRISVNNEISNTPGRLADDDEVILLPPFEGG
jgi:molybdopterin converting factor small subunit